MGHTKLRVRDAHRWCKKYPHLRVEPRPVLVGDNYIWLEAEEVKFENTNSVTYYFDVDFPDVPVVTANAVGASAMSTQQNVNVYIQTLTRFTVTLETSEAFTGTVHMQAVYIKC